LPRRWKDDEEENNMTSREAFLQRVRQAVTEGNRTGSAAPLPERGNVGVGFVDDPLSPKGVERFCSELAAAGGRAYVVSRPDEMLAQTIRIIEDKKAHQILLAPVFPQLDLAVKLRGHGLEVTCVEDLSLANCREPFFRADLGVTRATHLVAETGSVIMAAAQHEPRSVSLLPPVHVVLAHRRQILPDLFDLFALFSSGQNLPSCLSVITGPSKTGDIELKLVTGVHGPGEVHVIVGTWDS
jgi:L-lactate dehydrogenase complex protein LldG